MRIRAYRSSDRAAVLALQANSDAGLAAVVPENFYDDLRDIDAAYEGGAFVIAETENTILGMGGLLPTGEIVRMRVVDQHRRKGIGSQILEALRLRAKDLGLSRVFLHTLREQHAAVVRSHWLLRIRSRGDPMVTRSLRTKWTSRDLAPNE
jgi:GNAT superfamily N-acetyltransferase